MPLTDEEINLLIHDLESRDSDNESSSDEEVLESFEPVQIAHDDDPEEVQACTYGVPGQLMKPSDLISWAEVCHYVMHAETQQ